MTKYKKHEKQEPVGSLSCYSLYAVCVEAPVDHPDWQGQEWLRLDSRGNQSAGKADVCAMVANGLAKDLTEAHGGQWAGRIRDCLNDPYPVRDLPDDERVGCREHILAGPDGPGRRFLLGLVHGPMAQGIRAVMVPPAPPAEDLPF